MLHQHVFNVAQERAFHIFVATEDSPLHLRGESKAGVLNWLWSAALLLDVRKPHTPLLQKVTPRDPNPVSVCETELIRFIVGTMGLTLKVLFVQMPILAVINLRSWYRHTTPFIHLSSILDLSPSALQHASKFIFRFCFLICFEYPIRMLLLTLYFSPSVNCRWHHFYFMSLKVLRNKAKQLVMNSYRRTFVHLVVIKLWLFNMWKQVKQWYLVDISVAWMH